MGCRPVPLLVPVSLPLWRFWNRPETDYLFFVAKVMALISSAGHLANMCAPDSSWVTEEEQCEDSRIASTRWEHGKGLTAIEYGADALYLAGQRFGMRAQAGNFTLVEIKEILDTAHRRGSKDLRHGQHFSPQ